MRRDFCNFGFACAIMWVSSTCLLVLLLSTSTIAQSLARSALGGDIKLVHDDIPIEIHECPILPPVCRMRCRPGMLEVDEAGCHICECKDPCRDITCPAGQKCTIPTINCFVAPCPTPKPICENINFEAI